MKKASIESKIAFKMPKTAVEIAVYSKLLISITKVI
jgi:hypothetical protein